MKDGKIILALAILVFAISFSSFAHAAKIDVTIPGVPNTATSSPLDTIAGIYRFLMGISGFLALGVIIFGAVKYAASPGNVGSLGDAKEWIVAALSGLLLLAGAYILMRTINPQLTVLALPNLKPLPEAQVFTPSDIFPPTADVFACQDNSTLKLKACYKTKSDCESDCDVNPDITTGIAKESCIPVKGNACPANVGGGIGTLKCATGNCTPIGLSWEYKNGKQADPVMVTELQCIANAGITLRVTEAMPPSSAHQSVKHTNGCAVDATIPTIKTAADCSNIAAVKSAVASCGGTSLNEYFNLCARTPYAGTNTEHSTGDHIHINAACGL